MSLSFAPRHRSVAWFGPKRHGRGVTPKAPEGWLCAGVYAAVCVVAASRLQGAGHAPARVLIVGLSTLFFVLIIRRTWSAATSP